MAEVSSLVIYPVKGCQGVHVDEALVLPTGERSIKACTFLVSMLYRITLLLLPMMMVPGSGPCDAYSPERS